MTTVAFDGTTMAADTLATDGWGLKEQVFDKMLRGKDFIIGLSGGAGSLRRWWKTVCHLSAEELVNAGFEPYEKDANDPGIIICTEHGIWRHAAGSFVAVHGRTFHAVGSGRDYALAAMHCGLPASGAVRVAMEFDNNTGGAVVELRLDDAS